MKYRKKPVVIEAFQLNRESSIKEGWFLNALIRRDIIINYEGWCKIKTVDGGWANAYVGDYIIRGINGEIYPCKADIFEKTYEKVDE